MIDRKAQTTVREVVGRQTLAEIDRVNVGIREILDDVEWGSG